jgi:hyperosmotically inducible protein
MHANRMKRALLAGSAIALVALAGCDRSNTAYNNSGASASSAPGAAMSTPSTSASGSDPASPAAAGTSAVAANTAPAAPAGNVVADTVTTGKVQSALAADSGLKDSDITVTTNNGVVVLTGTAKSQDQVTMASNLAQRQEGVSRVDSQVVVR